MNVLIIGAAGMIGARLARALARKGEIGGRRITAMTLADVSEPGHPEGGTFSGPIEAITGDLSVPGHAESLIEGRPDLIFHLAAIVSGEAEQDFEKGYRVNVDGTRALFEAVRKVEGYTPKIVFSSSIVVFGQPLPDVIGDDQCLTPLTSYGTQKAICELLLADYSRKGYFDGVGVRLPTISIRPGKPNRAASGFFSSILREPLIGQEAVLPVSETVRHWFASPRAAVAYLLHAADLDTARLGSLRTLTMPGVSASVGDQIAALRRVAGPRAVALIRREPDRAIEAIIAGWPRGFDASRALALGFVAEGSFDDIIRAHIEDELTAPQPA